MGDPKMDDFDTEYGPVFFCGSKVVNLISTPWRYERFTTQICFMNPSCEKNPSFSGGVLKQHVQKGKNHCKLNVITGDYFHIPLPG